MNFTKVASPAPRTGYVKAGLVKSALNAAFSAAVAMGVLGDGQAQAKIFVSVDGHIWEISTFKGSFDDNAKKFGVPGAGGVMPWWSGNGPFDIVGMLKVKQFSDAVAEKGAKYKFAFSLSDTGDDGDNENGDEKEGVDYLEGVGPLENIGPFFAQPNENLEWAQARKPEEVPGPLPALGVAAAFRFSRKLRKRLKSSKPEVIITTAV